MIYGLTYLGVFHTLISLIALLTGAVALIRNNKITWDNQLGKTYVISTIIVCLTGFGIFQHGGFGKPHALGVVTLIVLGIIYLAANKKFGTSSTVIETVCYSMTFFFHIVPTIAESATRLPYGHPLAASPEDPGVQKVTGIFFLLFLIGAYLQIRSMKKKASPQG